MADLNSPGSRRLSYPLHFYAKAGDLPRVLSILQRLTTQEERRDTLSARDEKGEIPFHSAASGGHVEVLEALLREGQDPNTCKCAMHVAAAHGRLKVVQWLMFSGLEDLIAQDEKGNTPLHLAVRHGHKDVVKFLVSREASLSVLNQDSMMPVSYCRDQEMFKELLPYHGSSFNARREGISQKDYTNTLDAQERSILHYAAQYATDQDVISTLISETDAVGRQDSQGNSFLHFAAKAGNIQVLEVLKKIDPDVTTSLLISGRNKLHISPGLCALLHNHREFFDVLVGMGTVDITLECIIKGLIVELIDNKEILERLPLFVNTLPTYLALSANKDQVFKFLLETTKLTINQWDDKYKSTCLHWAVVHKRKDIVKKLSENVHVMPSIQDALGKTALQHAFELKQNEVMVILRRSSAFRDHEEKLFRDRGVYVQGLNAILVGAALIASVTFAAWLQLLPNSPDAVFTTLGLKVFWASNSLSFFLAVATMCVAIGALLPTPNKYVGDIADQLRLAVVMAATLLALSLAAVMWAFAAAGFAALRHSHVSQYQASMRVTTVVGGFICTLTLLAFFLQLCAGVPAFPGILLTLLRFVPRSAGLHQVRCLQNTLALAGGSSRSGYDNMSQQHIKDLMDVQLVGRCPAKLLTLSKESDLLEAGLRNLQISEKESFMKGIKSFVLEQGRSV